MTLYKVEDWGEYRHPYEFIYVSGVPGPRCRDRAEVTGEPRPKI